jgi:hypothetical protein
MSVMRCDVTFNYCRAEFKRVIISFIGCSFEEEMIGDRQRVRKNRKEKKKGRKEGRQGGRERMDGMMEEEKRGRKEGGREDGWNEG